MKHLAHMSLHDAKTGMHCKNLAIVWAPNLLKFVHFNLCPAMLLDSYLLLTVEGSDRHKWMIGCVISRVVLIEKFSVN